MNILDKYIELKELSKDNIYLIDIVNYYKDRLRTETNDNDKLLIYLKLLVDDLNMLLKHKNHIRQQIKEINTLVKNIKSSNTIIKNNI